jgi:hypothetical protein
MVPLLRKGAAPDMGYTAASALLAGFVVFVVSAPIGLVWPVWGCCWSITMAGYLALVAVEAVRQARRISDVAGTMVALAAGNLAPGAGFVLKALHLVPDLRGIYRNDR